MKMEQVYRYTLVRDLRRPLSLLGCESVADGGDEDQAARPDSGGGLSRSVITMLILSPVCFEV